MKSIGKYQVIEQLGASAAGTTYRVRDSFRNREFALKVLQTVPGLTAAAKEQFCGHLASCSELVHRHVVKVQDMGEVEEGIFVVSDWRTGMDFERFMGQNRDLPLGQKLALIAQVAEGLAFAHSREIARGVAGSRQPAGRPGSELSGAGTGAGTTVRCAVRHIRVGADVVRVRLWKVPIFGGGQLDSARNRA